MKLLHAYDYYFYRIYRWSCFVNKSLHGGPAYHSLVTVIMMTLALALNISCLIIAYFDLYDRPVPVPSNIVILVAVVFILTANYLYFVATQRYKVVVSRYHRESHSAIKYGLVGTFFYFLLSVVLFFVAVLTSVHG
jgi:hypothetical protein